MFKVFENPVKISPVEFVTISLMVAVNKERMGVGSAGSANGKAQLAAAIGDMRKDVRDVHVDIRINNKVAKTMLKFIRGVAKGNGKQQDAAGAGKKRKRVPDDGE